MKKLLLAVAALTASGMLSVHAQEIFGGSPYSYDHELNDAQVSKYTVPALDMSEVMREDNDRESTGVLPLFSRTIPTSLNLDNSGEWTTLPNGDRLWKLRVESRDALALSFGFDQFVIPQGARLHVYNIDRTEHFGAFTSQSNSDLGKYAIPPVRGEVIMLEYYEPAEKAGQANISIEWVGHAYRFIKTIEQEQAELEAQRADPCHVDIRCSEGAPFWDEKRGVVRIIVVSSQGQGFCSGSLVNNTNNDCKAYILTAMHCAVGGTPQYDQWSFTFNYERNQCGLGIAPNNQFLSGCTRRADSNDGGGNNGSDFLLVETDDQVPDSYDAYFNGWDASGDAPSSGMSIHHPDGDAKKISSYTSSLTTSGWGSFNTHWRVIWTGTSNGHGVTEGGSSGSPIFDEGPTPKIVGTLTGGGSFCNTTQPGGQNQPDFYGKMDWHWSNNPNATSQKLKEWLDPAGTGQLSMEGSFNPCGIYTSIEENTVTDLVKVYPNPSIGNFQVDLEFESNEQLRVDVINLMGARVYSNSSVSTDKLNINLSGQPQGVYFVTVTAGHEQFTQKVTVLR